jgi:hypothetical protein
MTPFGPRQQHTLAVAFMDANDRLAHMEGLIAQADRVTAFSRYVRDLTSVEQRVLLEYFTQIRRAMQDLLTANQIPLEVTPVSLRWALETGLGRGDEP